MQKIEARYSTNRQHRYAEQRQARQGYLVSCDITVDCQICVYKFRIPHSTMQHSTPLTVTSANYESLLYYTLVASDDGAKV